MSDILLGVIIGGLIASITPIVMIILDHRRWQRQSTLEQLRFERKRLEKIFRENLKRFSKAITENSYPSDMIKLQMIPPIIRAKAVPTILPPIISGDYGCGEGIRLKSKN